MNTQPCGSGPAEGCHKASPVPFRHRHLCPERPEPYLARHDCLVARTRQQTWDEAVTNTHRHRGRYGLLLALAAVAAVANALRLIVDVVGGRLDVSALIALFVLILTGWISGVVASQFLRRPHPPWYWLAPGATRS